MTAKLLQLENKRINVSVQGIVTNIFSVEKNGDVCISILHEPGDDKWGYEKASERWLPVHTVETILISVISMLADPNDESPANVDAAVSSNCQQLKKAVKYVICMILYMMQCILI